LRDEKNGVGDRGTATACAGMKKPDTGSPSSSLEKLKRGRKNLVYALHSLSCRANLSRKLAYSCGILKQNMADVIFRWDGLLISRIGRIWRRSSANAGKPANQDQPMPRNRDRRAILWRKSTLEIDPTIARKSFTTDCEVCCRPLRGDRPVEAGKF